MKCLKIAPIIQDTMPPIKIAVNTRLLLCDRMEGIGYFTYETMRYIVLQHPEVEFHFLFDRPYDPSFIFADNVKPVILFPPARHPFLWFAWFAWSVKRYLAKHKFSLFLSPDGYLPLHTATPTVVVQHDIAFVHYPKSIDWLTSQYYHYFVPKFLHSATRIATVSAYSKSDIVQHYHIAPDTIDVVYSAAKDIFHPIANDVKQAVRKTYTDGKPYLLYVGSINARKNLKNMLLAFDRFKQVHGGDLQFVIAGAMGWQNSDLQPVLDSMQHRSQVIFIGRQPLDTLVSLIGASFALLYVSLFEGFGVPPLEGMACGVPVITSSVSSLPEVCADAALLVSPTDVEAIATAIAALWLDPTLCATLIDRGYIQAQQWTWQRTAELLWHCCERAME